MSHIAQVDVQVNDLDSLERACKRVNATLVRDVHDYIWYAGQKKRCTHVIRVEGASYEIGVIKRGDKGFTLEADFWSSGGLRQTLGEGAVKLTNAYCVELARKHYEQEGWMLDIQTREDGTIVVECQK